MYHLCPLINRYDSEGVEVFPNTLLKGVTLEEEKVKLITQDDQEASARGGGGVSSG